MLKRLIESCVLYIVVFAVFLVGCSSILLDEEVCEETMTTYYTIDDFSKITINQSTYQDVCAVALPEHMQITSYGGFCEYPMEDGRVIRIEFYGSDLVVRNIITAQKGQGDGSLVPLRH